MFRQRLMVLTVSLLSAGVASARADVYPANFGLAADLVATGNRMTVNYFGWEATTYYGHTIWAMTTSQYQDNRNHGCFGGGCSSMQGLSLFTKPFGQSAFDQVAYGNTTFSVSNYFAPEAPVVFVLQVNQGDMYNWFFSGDPSRNHDGKAHLGFFSSGGVPVHPYESPIVPGTSAGEIYGFEDATYNESDWDFNNALFSVYFDDDPDHPWEDPTPEPATLTLLATGMMGLAAARKRWRSE